ncbi:MAG: methylated-DNA--[protein]-cysteine S-methyltransferase [Saprospiraceae bacterium]
MDNRINIDYLKSPYGEFIIGSFKNKLILCDYRFRKMRTTIDKRINEYFNADYDENSDDIIEETKLQLSQYFSGERQKFTIPLMLAGSGFQKSVWESLLQIPYGKTISYKELSKIMGNEKAIRAVANANGANAISIIIPCHRVIGSNGELTGYAGELNVKELIEIRKN